MPHPSEESEIRELSQSPFREIRWREPAWGAYLVLRALVAALFITLAIGMSGGIWDKPLLVDLAKAGLFYEVPSLGAGFIALYFGRRYRLKP